MINGSDRVNGTVRVAPARREVDTIQPLRLTAHGITRGEVISLHS
jgi:hypothetical protein